MKRRFRSRWLRAKMWRILRTHYMVSFTIVALLVAAAGALGYFEAQDGPSRPRAAAVAPTPTPVPFNTPASFAPGEPLTVTFYLVDSERHRRVLEGVEDGLIFREVLQKDAFEVLVVSTPEQEEEARRVIEQAQVLAEESGFILLVRDLRE